MPIYHITATACLSRTEFAFGPVDMHFAMPAPTRRRAKQMVAAYLYDEGIICHKLMRTKETTVR